MFHRVRGTGTGARRPLAVLQLVEPDLDVAQLLLGDPRDFQQRIPVFELLRLVFQVPVKTAVQIAPDGGQAIAQAVAFLLEFVSIHDIFPGLPDTHCRIRRRSSANRRSLVPEGLAEFDLECVVGQHLGDPYGVFGMAGIMLGKVDSLRDPVGIA